ncbi:MAG: hypothetical protein COB14_05165 [Alphaproteobacteria bacterium]|nr:MAG: hypothetical protein COB14_05165 [Alphaproteobacteria bacterium]
MVNIITKENERARHAIDPRILTIKNIEDFSLWKNRNLLNDNNIHGITCDYPLALTEIKKAGQHLAQIAENPNSAFTTSQFMSTPENVSGKKYYSSFFLEDNNIEQLNQTLISEGINKTTRTIITNITSAFLGNCPDDIKNTQFDPKVEIDINFTSNIGLHTHSDALTFTFNQEGTLAISEQGNPYTIPAGQIFLFDDKVLHDSPPYQSEWEEDPRVTLILQP